MSDCQCGEGMFASMHSTSDYSVDYQVVLVTLLLMRSCISQGDLQAEEELDEGVLRTASALHCLVAVVGITCKWRSKAITSIFSLKVEKSLDTGKLIYMDTLFSLKCFSSLIKFRLIISTPNTSRYFPMAQTIRKFKFHTR